jgi:hypothetical protein
MPEKRLIEFNPQPRIERVDLGNGQSCFVIDDALMNPERLVQFAVDRRIDFRMVDYNAYPGLLLPTPGEISEKLNAFFIENIRGMFDVRRIVSMHSRLAMVTLQPESLRPYQRVCHSDNFQIDGRHSLQASVLYLFDDTSLGGTSFYYSKMAPHEMLQLFDDAAAMSNAQFTQRHGVQPGYLCETNRYFHRIARVEAKWNRLIFYDGALLHSGDIAAPEKLSADPAVGRLTLNGFFTSRRHAA